MIIFSYPKINLGLKIVRKRSDGYHDLESIFYPLYHWKDALEIVESAHFRFENTGIVVDAAPEKNLVVRAYRLLCEKFALPPIHIHLHKTIPMGAGLGGGSSNATFMLKLLNDFFDLQFSVSDLLQYALQLGSDCPFFVQDGPKYVTGRGEHLQNISLDLQNYFITVIYPNVSITTAEAFAGIQPAPSEFSFLELVQAPFAQWKKHLHNDFETTIFSRYPILAQLKANLYQAGALYASMSGSGSAMYGIFEKPTMLDTSFLQKTLPLSHAAALWK